MNWYFRNNENLERVHINYSCIYFNLIYFISIEKAIINLTFLGDYTRTCSKYAQNHNSN